MLNFKKIVASDRILDWIDIINSNFDELIANGGGLRGYQGIQGIQGIQGLPGLQGVQGIQGNDGSKWFVGSGNPNVGDPANTLGAVDGDLYIDTASTDIYLFDDSFALPNSWILQGSGLVTSYFTRSTTGTPERIFNTTKEDFFILSNIDNYTAIAPPPNPFNSKMRIATANSHLQLVYSDGVTDFNNASLLFSVANVNGDSTIQSLGGLTITSNDGLSLQDSTYININTPSATVTAPLTNIITDILTMNIGIDANINAIGDWNVSAKNANLIVSDIILFDSGVGFAGKSPIGTFEFDDFYVTGNNTYINNLTGVVDIQSTSFQNTQTGSSTQTVGTSVINMLPSEITQTVGTSVINMLPSEITQTVGTSFIEIKPTSLKVESDFTTINSNLVTLIQSPLSQMTVSNSNIAINSNGSATITANTDITITATDDIFITASDAIIIRANNATTPGFVTSLPTHIATIAEDIFMGNSTALTTLHIGGSTNAILTLGSVGAGFSSEFTITSSGTGNENNISNHGKTLFYSNTNGVVYQNMTNSFSIFTNVATTTPAHKVTHQASGVGQVLQQYLVDAITPASTFTWDGNNLVASTFQASAISDENLKENIVPTTKGISDIMSLNVKDFDWKSNQKTETGLIAQEVFEVLPDAVYDRSEYNIENELNVGDEGYQYLGLFYTKIIPILIKAIQDLKGLNDATQSDLDIAESSLTTAQLDIINLQSDYASLLARVETLEG